MTSAVSPARSPWLMGPVRDLAIGCGAVYVLVFAALAFAGDAVRAALPLGLAVIPVTLISVPHYGATLLRVYEREDDRRRYRFFAVWTTVALAALFVAGLRSAAVGSWVATVYLTWSPWHYAGQNFGIGMMFLRRRGVDVTPTARRLYWWSFALSFALAFLALHGETRDASYAPDDFVATALTFRSFGVPDGIRGVAMYAVAALYVGATVGAFVLLARRGKARDLLPAAVLVVSQALWFTLPTLAREANAFGGSGPLGERYAHYGFLWIASAHAAQYLWITSYYATRTGSVRRHGVFLLKSLAAGAAVWTLPALLFAPGALGRLPYDAGLGLLVSSCVNLHHFVLDGAIWKLRDGPIARILLGGERAAAPAAKRRVRIGPWALAVGAACVLVMVYAAAETEFGYTRAVARGDVAAAEASVHRLAGVGRDSVAMHVEIADLAAKAGDRATARREGEDAVRLHPTAWAWVSLGRTLAQEENWPAAGNAFARALELEPRHPVALLYSGVVDMETGREGAGRDKILRARDAARDEQVADEVAKVMSLYGVR